MKLINLTVKKSITVSFSWEEFRLLMDMLLLREDAWPAEEKKYYNLTGKLERWLASEGETVK